MKLSKIIITAIVLILITPISSSQLTVNVQISPSTLLPGDVADCVLTITNPTTKQIKVTGIDFIPSGIRVSPNSISEIGILSAGSSHEIPFAITTENPGRHTVEAKIYTTNGTISRLIMLNVEDRSPKILLVNPLVLNEVNTLRFKVVNTVSSISEVQVEALFDAEPRIVELTDLTSEGHFEYLPVSDTSEGADNILQFEISYYNGNNFHQVIDTVYPTYRESKGIVINSSVPYQSVNIKDVIPLNVKVSNLREDSIYSVKVTAFIDDSDKKTKEISTINTMKDSMVSFKFSPNNIDLNKIKIEVKYRDKFNNEYTVAEEVEITVLDEKPITISNIDTERKKDTITISGDISNIGKSTAYNVLLFMEFQGKTKTFYLGTIDSSDFDSFEFEFTDRWTANGTNPNLYSNSNLNSGLDISNKEMRAFLTVSWNNELGEKAEITQGIDVEPSATFQPAHSENLIYVGAAIAVFIIALVAFIWIKSR